MRHAYASTISVDFIECWGRLLLDGRASRSGSEGPPGCAPVHGPSPSTLSQGERVLKVLIYSICPAYLAPALLRIVTWVLSPAWRFCSIRPSTCSVMVLWFGSTFFTVAVVIAAPVEAVQ